MNTKRLKLYVDLLTILLLACVVWWVRETVPHTYAMLKSKSSVDKELVPYWLPIPMFAGMIIFHTTWLLEKYFNYRIRKAMEQHSYSQGLMSSIQKAPKQFKPEERIEAIDNYFVTQLEVRKAAAKGWLSEVSVQIGFIGGVLMTFPFWPLMYLMYGALFGIVK